MAIAVERPWIPSAVGAVAAAAFLLFHLDRPWISNGEPTPILVPCLIAIVLLVGCLVDVLIVLTATSATVEQDDEEAGNHARLFWYLGSLAAFALLMQRIGFVPVVIVVLPLLLIFGERLPVLKSIIVTITTAAVVYLVFDVVLDVDLPHGTFFAGWF